MEILTTLIYFLIALGILVVVHEYGHFIVARYFGVRVLVFSVGFGSPIYSWQDRRGTDFRIATIPFGGYVKMLDLREGEVPSEQMHEEFSSKPVGQRLAVYFAGPLANFLLAIAIYWGVALLGVDTVIPVIGHVESGSYADQSDMTAGMEIVSIDDVTTPDWEAVIFALVERMGDSGNIRFGLKSADSNDIVYNLVTVDQFLRNQDPQIDPLTVLGIKPLQLKIPAVIAKVLPDSAAEQAGLLPDDEILAVDGVKVQDWHQWVAMVRSSAGRSMSLSVLREENIESITIKPILTTTETGEQIGQVGVSVVAVTVPKEMMRTIRFNLLDGFFYAVEKTKDLTVLILSTLRKMLVGLVSVQHLSGPITIAQVAGDSAASGWLSFVNFLAYLSVSLAVLNLLPIPVLDGGHILFGLVECIIRRPVPETVQRVGLGFGVSVLMFFMIIAFYNDFIRLLNS